MTMMSEMERFVAVCRGMGERVPDPEDLVAIDGEYDPHWYGTPEDVTVRYRVPAFGQTLFFDADGRYLGFLITESLPGWVGRGEPSP